MTASKGLRPALLFLSSGASLTTASIWARKLSKGTTALSVSSGSPLALIASRRVSRSKKPGCPTAFPRAADARTRESDLRAAGQSYFSRYPIGFEHRLSLRARVARHRVVENSLFFRVLHPIGPS